MSRPIPLFISYALQDEAFLAECARHLAPLEEAVTVWHPGRIPPGAQRAVERDGQLERARVVVHLISADYLADETCKSLADRAIMLEETSVVSNIGVLLRACLWRSSKRVPSTVLPEGGLPVASWSNRDEAWTAVATTIKSVVDFIHAAAPIAELVRAGSTPQEPFDPGTGVPYPGALRRLEGARDFTSPPPTPGRADKSTDRRSNVAELITILEHRAGLIQRDLQKQYQHIEVREYLHEFEVLHREHVECLRAGSFMQAHELAERIHRLSWRLESDSFWRKHRLERPSIRYRLRDDAFSRGPVALAYLPGLMVHQSPHSSFSHPTTQETYLDALQALRAPN